MEDERVFEAREMLAEIVAWEHPEMAAALLEGVLDDGRFFVVSSTLDALAGDGAGAEAVALAEHRLVEIARAASTEVLGKAAGEFAEGLSSGAREGLAEQWCLAAELTGDGPDPLQPVEDVVRLPAEDASRPAQVRRARGMRRAAARSPRGAMGARRRRLGGFRVRTEAPTAHAWPGCIAVDLASDRASVATPSGRPGRHAPGRAPPPGHSPIRVRTEPIRVGRPSRHEHRRSRRPPRRVELRPAPDRRRAEPRGSAPDRRGSRA